MRLIQTIRQLPLYHSIAVRYQKLSSQDQRALQGLAIFLACFLLYLFLWAPLSQWSQQQRADFIQQKSVYSWVQTHIAQVPTDHPRKTPDSQMLSPIIAQAAKESGITLTRVQPNDKHVSVWIDETPYQSLLPWLVNLETQQSLTIQQIRIDRLQQSGVVKAFIQFGS